MPEQISDGLERNLSAKQVASVCVSECMASAPPLDVDTRLLQTPLNH
jgi:hypothetical protein